MSPAVVATLIYCLLNVEQAAIWMTYAPVPTVAKQYLDIGSVELNLLANWSPPVFLLVVPFAGQAAVTSGTFRMAKWAATLALLATFLRVLPMLLLSESSEYIRDARRVTAHLAAIVNAVVGPLVMGTISQVASDYVTPRRQGLAVGVIWAGENIGGACQALLAPRLATSAGSMGHLLVAHFVAAAGIWLLTVAAMPTPTPRAPSCGAVSSSATSPSSGAPMLRSYLAVAAGCSFQWLFWPAAACSGVASAEGALVTQLLELRAPGFAPFSDVSAGWLMTAACLTCMAGNLVGGGLASSVFAERLSWLGCGVRICQATVLTCAALCLPRGSGHAPLLPGAPQVLVAGAMAASAGLQGMGGPANIMLAALVTRPAPPAKSMALMTFGFQAAVFVSLFVVPSLGDPALIVWAHIATVVANAACYPLVDEAGHRRRSAAPSDALLEPNEEPEHALRSS